MGERDRQSGDVDRRHGRYSDRNGRGTDRAASERGLVRSVRRSSPSRPCRGRYAEKSWRTFDGSNRSASGPAAGFCPGAANVAGEVCVLGRISCSFVLPSQFLRNVFLRLAWRSLPCAPRGRAVLQGRVITSNLRELQPLWLVAHFRTSVVLRMKTLLRGRQPDRSSTRRRTPRRVEDFAHGNNRVERRQRVLLRSIEDHSS